MSTRCRTVHTSGASRFLQGSPAYDDAHDDDDVDDDDDAAADDDDAAAADDDDEDDDEEDDDDDDDDDDARLLFLLSSLLQAGFVESASALHSSGADHSELRPGYRRFWKVAMELQRNCVLEDLPPVLLAGGSGALENSSAPLGFIGSAGSLVTLEVLGLIQDYWDVFGS